MERPTEYDWQDVLLAWIIGTWPLWLGTALIVVDRVLS